MDRDRGATFPNPSLSRFEHNLRRTRTSPELALKIFSAEESEKVQSARLLVNHLKVLTSEGLGKYVIDANELGVTRKRARTKHSRDKAMERTVHLLEEKIPSTRTPSLELDLAEVVGLLSCATKNDEARHRLEQLAEPGTLGITLDQGIAQVLETGELAELLAFEPACWKPEHFKQLLLTEGGLRPGAFQVARQLLRGWLDLPSAPTCLRESGPVSLLLKCFLVRLAPWSPTLEPVEDQAEALYLQLMAAIAALNPRLLSLLRLTEIEPSITPESLLNFLCLRHYLPWAEQAGLPEQYVGSLLSYCLFPPPQLEPYRQKLLKLLRRSP